MSLSRRSPGNTHGSTKSYGLASDYYSVTPCVSFLVLLLLLLLLLLLRRPHCWGRAPGKPVGPSNCFVRLLPPPPPPSYSPNKTNVVLFCPPPFPPPHGRPPKKQPMFFSFVQFSVLYSLETTQITPKFTTCLPLTPPPNPPPRSLPHPPANQQKQHSKKAWGLGPDPLARPDRGPARPLHQKKPMRNDANNTQIHNVPGPSHPTPTFKKSLGPRARPSRPPGPRPCPPPTPKKPMRNDANNTQVHKNAPCLGPLTLPPTPRTKTLPPLLPCAVLAALPLAWLPVVSLTVAARASSCLGLVLDALCRISH